MRDVLRINGLRKTFRLHSQGVEITALDGVRLAVAEGECVALVGPSGAGKSTLLRCVYGNYVADAGEVLVRQGDTFADVATNDPRQVLGLRRRVIGYVSQFLRVVPRVSTLDVVAEPALRAGVAREPALDRARRLLEQLAIPQRLWGLPPQTFSGGEQQRVNIARAFAYDYDLILLDEPTASLDADNRRRAAGLVRDALSRGAAVLGVFHDLDTAGDLDARCFAMEAPVRSAA